MQSAILIFMAQRPQFFKLPHINMIKRSFELVRDHLTQWQNQGHGLISAHAMPIDYTHLITHKCGA
jgi:hypothetical protein